MRCTFESGLPAVPDEQCDTEQTFLEGLPGTPGVKRLRTLQPEGSMALAPRAELAIQSSPWC